MKISTMQKKFNILFYTFGIDNFILRMYVFCLDGVIICNIIDCPGGWHDGLIFDRCYDFLMSLLNGLWILRDSAFARIPGKVERCKKKGEYLPQNNEKAEFQLLLEEFCGNIRMKAEWKLKDLKKS
jgi:hypothetical protein